MECTNPDVLSRDQAEDEALRVCFNIDVDENDVFYANRIQVLPLTRSDGICHGEVREQFNALTAFIDGSQIYGSDDTLSKQLRTLENGLLKVHRLGPTMPTRSQTGLLDEHFRSEDLVGGDIRAIEQPGLASLHSLFVNEHNRIAKEIQQANQELNDEDIFQEARRFVIAELQNIVYNEFLPTVLGADLIKDHKLTLNEDETTLYHEAINPAISNEFATFAFRFGHTLVPNFLRTRGDPKRTNSVLCPIKDNFFKFEEFVLGKDYSGRAWENLLFGLSTTESQPFSPKISDHITNYLYCGTNCNSEDGFGEDLAARNIQRGRDHGIPGYTKYRKWCGLSVPSSWNYKPTDISQQYWDNLKLVYNSVTDIDAFTGGVSEDSIPDGVVGRTFGCILANQFQNLIKGDRFFFTHKENGIKKEKGWSIDERKASQIHTRKLSDIMCDNMDFESMPRNIFQSKSDLMSCNENIKLRLNSQTDFVVPKPSQTNDFCQPGWKHFEGKCYKYIDQKNTWIGAKAVCNAINGELAVPSTESKNRFISREFTSDEIWIGGFKNEVSGKWEWVDGSVWSYSSWHSNPQQPSGDGPVIVTNYRGSMLWNDRQDIVSNYNRAFVCQVSCKEGWSYYPHTKNCYKYFPTLKTPSAANDYCKTESEEGSLVSVHDDDTNYFLRNSFTNERIWLGAFRAVVGKDVWEWTDGSPWDYTNWAHNKPDGASYGENYVHLYDGGTSSSGFWNDVKDSQQYSFVCQYYSMRSRQNKASAIITTGGYFDNAYRSVEALHSDGTPLCKLPDLPDDRQAHTMEGGMLCGVYDWKDTNRCKSCLKYEAGTWKKYEWSRLKGRARHVSWKRPDGKIQLMGGLFSGTTSEVVSSSGSQPGFDLKYDTRRACAIKLELEVIITGGDNTLTTVSKYTTDGWKYDLPSFKKERFGHGCGSYYNSNNELFYLIAGGHDGDLQSVAKTALLSSTEIMSASGDSWSFAKPLPESKYQLRGLSLNKEILMIGGMTDILKFDEDSNKWNPVEQLKTGRYYHAVTVLPLDEIEPYCVS